jgi:hypothetical protein
MRGSIGLILAVACSDYKLDDLSSDPSAGPTGEDTAQLPDEGAVTGTADVEEDEETATDPDPDPDTGTDVVPDDPCDGVADPADLLADGSFEDPAGGGKIDVGTTFGSWAVDIGSVEVVPPTDWAYAGECDQWLDLNGWEVGGIAQTVQPEAGVAYTLSFLLSGNYYYGGTKTLRVLWDDDVLGDFTFDTTGRTAADMGWRAESVDVPVDATVVPEGHRLRFLSTTDDLYSAGPALDGITLRPTGT